MDDVGSSASAERMSDGPDALAQASASAIAPSPIQERTGPRILRGVTPVADESLIGLIARSCAASHMPLVTPLLSSVAPVGHAYMNLACREDVDFAQLAWAARLTACDVEARLYSRVEITSDLPGFRFHGTTIAAYDLGLKQRRFAPAWLERDAHHSALGHLGLLTHCPRTGEVLIDRCPRCRTGFTWSSSVLRNCHHCMLDLRTCDRERIAENDLRSTALMSTILHPDPKLHLAAVRRLPKRLTSLDRGEVFELGWRVGSIFAGVGVGKRDGARKLPATTRIEILKAGSKMLSSWPEGLRKACSDAASADAAAGLRLAKQLRLLVRGRNSWPCHADIMLDALPGLASSDKATLKNAIGQAGNSAETQRVLGVSQRTFERLWKASILCPIAVGGTINRHQIFRTDKLRATAALLADRMDLGSASQRLGISHHGVEQLCALNQLSLLGDPAVRLALLRRQVSRSSFDALVEALENSAAQQLSGEELPLRRAAAAIGGREKPWGAILVAMIEGSLAFRLDGQRDAPLTSRVLVPRHQLDVLTGMDFARPRRCRIDFTSRINRRDAEELLNLTPRIFQEALIAGELPASESGTYGRADILRLARLHISGGEILARWGGRGRKMPSPLRALPLIGSKGRLGRLRHEVEALMAKHERADRYDLSRLEAET
ncbi:hypothetical protein [Sphingomonas sp. S2-65]|uniref:hypothetical protein n=1 Tax=Sphingomonas sp. S2-65 TaxID=2903960 RepID=UPI001F34562C|nr:hypothetical protein [Sphingomonas sp. S2-65]UYY57998.1 hypothetical protein LZ586_15240 [Sphingomonas sp. S2-65]